MEESAGQKPFRGVRYSYKCNGSRSSNSSIVSSFVPSAITWPFFELQPPDFAWKFVWTVPTNYAK